MTPRYNGLIAEPAKIVLTTVNPSYRRMRMTPKEDHFHVVSFLQSSVWAILPDTCLHVSRACREKMTCRTWCHRDDRVFVPLKHHLGVACVRIPELHSSILRTRHDPLAIRGQAHTKHVVLTQVSMTFGIGQKFTYFVSFKGPDTLASA